MRFINILWNKLLETWSPGGYAILAACMMRCIGPSPGTLNLEIPNRLEPFNDSGRLDITIGWDLGMDKWRGSGWMAPDLCTF